MSGYLIVNLVANQQPLSPQAEHGWWYQYYFATDRGVRGYRQNTPRLQQAHLARASPTWKFDDATYDRTAAAFDNPDHVDIVIHNYRWRLGLAQGEPQYDDLDRKLAASPPIPCRPSPSAATSTAPTRMVRPTARCSPARTRTGSSTASDTTCRKRRRRPSRMRSSPPTTSNAAWVILATVGYERRTVDELITALTTGRCGSPCRR